MGGRGGVGGRGCCKGGFGGGGGGGEGTFRLGFSAELHPIKSGGVFSESAGGAFKGSLAPTNPQPRRVKKTVGQFSKGG